MDLADKTLTVLLNDLLKAQMNPVLGTLHKAPRELRTHFRRIYWIYSCIAIAVRSEGTRSGQGGNEAETI